MIRLKDIIYYDGSSVLVRKEQLNEQNLRTPVELVKRQLERFKDALQSRAGGSFESDSVEYEKDRWENNSRMYKGRYKQLSKWEKKVNKALMGLIRDYEKAWVVK